MKSVNQIRIFGMFFVLSIFFGGGCKLEQYASGDFPDQYIAFGTRDGSTGEEDKKVLLPNGMLFGHHIGDTKYALLAEIKKTEAKKLIHEVVDAGIKTRQINNPSSMSYFLTYVENGTEYTWIWGQSITGMPKEVEIIMPKLNALIPSEGVMN